jgi:hypothetical protein
LQPTVLAIKAITADKTISLFMGLISVPGGYALANAAMERLWVKQLYNTRRDVQTRRVYFFLHRPNLPTARMLKMCYILTSFLQLSCLDRL